MAWSKKGAEKMAKLRAYYFNGGDFTKLSAKCEDTEEKPVIRYNIVKKRNDEPYHIVPQARLVGLDGITDEISSFLRWIIKN